MSYETIANTIRGRFNTEVVADTGLKVQYDNQKEEETDEKWVRFVIKFGEKSQVTSGAPTRRYRIVGVAIAQVFIPINLGDKDALELADTIETAFKTVTISGVVFKTPAVTNLGRDGKWWQVNVTCPFYTDEFA